MRKFIILFSLFSALWVTQAVHADADGQKKELVEILFLRDRIAHLNADWSSDPKALSKNTETFLVLKKELDKLGEFAWRYGMLLRQKVEEGAIITGHNRFVVLRIADAMGVASKKISEFTALYAPGEKKVKKDRLFAQVAPEEAQANILWLSAHLSIFNTFLRSYNGFYRNKDTRNLLKDLVRAAEGRNVRFDELSVIAEHSVSKKSQRHLRKAVKQYVSARSHMIGQRLNDQLIDLIGSIESNQTAHDLYNDVDFNIRSYGWSDGFSRAISGVVNAISKLFGNFAGRFRFRKGHLYDYEEYTKDTLARLRPLDILTEKTPFALTDTFIPGHYGHAALYLGTQAQLEEIGMWDHPVIRPHQADIQAGKVVLEALRPGVWLNTLEEFLNVDEVTVYRQKNVLADKAEVARIYERGLDQLGKEYDFNFDVNTLNKVVCSELVYHAFGTINWPIKYMLGRATISPDNIAELGFYRNSPISFNFGERALKQHREEVVGKLDIAQKLGFTQLEDGSFSKSVRRCRDVHQQNGDIQRVCYGTMEPLEYKASNESIYDLPGTADFF